MSRAKVAFAEACHFDVMVTEINPEQTTFKNMADRTWQVGGTEKYIFLYNPHGIPGGIWLFPELAPDTVTFYKVPSVQAFIADQNNEIACVVWGPSDHPRDNKKAAIVKDRQMVLWGIHEHSSDKDKVESPTD